MRKTSTKKSAKELIAEQRAEIVSRIVEDMENLGAQWIRPWKAYLQQQNAVSGHIYAGGNRLHLAFQAMARGYEDPRWCTYNQAAAKGWQVKKGAKSAKIERWKMCPMSFEDENAEDGLPLTYTALVPRLVGCWSVFNAGDLEGIPALEVPVLRTEGDEATSLIDGVIASSRCEVVESVGAVGAFYAPGSDRITMPHRGLFQSDSAFLSVLLHEMTHSTAHPSALNREIGAARGKSAYAFEELVAELGSVFAAEGLGVEASNPSGEHYERHVAYLESWLKALQSDPGYLFKAASKAEGASDYILDRYASSSLAEAV